jgi:hypothetical protein
LFSRNLRIKNKTKIFQGAHSNLKKRVFFISYLRKMLHSNFTCVAGYFMTRKYVIVSPFIIRPTNRSTILCLPLNDIGQKRPSCLERNGF